jgi:hypothetical protein
MQDLVVVEQLLQVELVVLIRQEQVVQEHQT